MIASVVTALLAAAFFGLNVHVQARALGQVGGLAGAALSVTMAAMFFWLVAPFVIDWSWWSSRSVWIFALCGMGFPALAQYFQIISVKNIGPSLTAALGSFTPFFAVMASIAILGEPLTVLSALGTLLMMLAIAMSSIRMEASPRHWSILLLCIPLGAAAARGIVQPFIKLGLAEIPNAFFATLVMFTSSAVMLSALAFGTLRKAPGIPLNLGHGWFAASGVINGTGIILLNFALQHGDVGVAAPLASTTPLWAVFFGKYVFHSETTGPRHFAIAALVACGAMIIVTGR